jgi:hypothetical protein
MRNYQKKYKKLVYNKNKQLKLDKQFKFNDLYLQKYLN